MITTSSTSTYPMIRQPEFAVVQINFMGGHAIVHFDIVELERVKRGTAMISGTFNGDVARWDSMTPDERACYERDAEWLCARIDQCKLKSLK